MEKDFAFLNINNVKIINSVILYKTMHTILIKYLVRTQLPKKTGSSGHIFIGISFIYT